MSADERPHQTAGGGSGVQLAHLPFELHETFVGGGECRGHAADRVREQPFFTGEDHLGDVASGQAFEAILGDRGESLGRINPGKVGVGIDGCGGALEIIEGGHGIGKRLSRSD